MTGLETFIDSLKRGAREECFSAARSLGDSDASVTEKYETVFIPALQLIGSEWEANDSSTIDEHLASEIINDIVSYDAVNIQPVAALGKTVLIGCVPNEYHQLAAKMMANCLAERGWTIRFYGSSAPGADLLRCIGDLRPDLVLFSMKSVELLEGTITLLRELRERYPSVRIMLGGISGSDLRTVLLPYVDSFADGFQQAAAEAERITTGS